MVFWKNRSTNRIKKDTLEYRRLRSNSARPTFSIWANLFLMDLWHDLAMALPLLFALLLCFPLLGGYLAIIIFTIISQSSSSSQAASSSGALLLPVVLHTGDWGN